MNHLPDLKRWRALTLVLATLSLVGASTQSVHGQETKPKKMVIRMAALGGLRFEYKKFYVHPGVKVQLIIENRDEMMHNLAVGKPGTHIKIVKQAESLGWVEGFDFVPKSSDILWATKVIKPGESATLEFVAPRTKGEYPYICTYPGHGYVMHGTMVVANELKPPVKTEAPTSVMDEFLEPGEDDGQSRNIIVRRMFMPDAGPASIAVSLPSNRSFCWDAGACRFRYAWAGGPTTRVELKEAPGLTGPLLYRETIGFPLRVETGGAMAAPKTVRFLGYRIDAVGHPEFEYEVDDVNVRERIDILSDRMIRSFKTDATKAPVWFAFDPKSPPASQPSVPIVRGDSTLSFYQFTAKQARAFTITTPLVAAPAATTTTPTVVKAGTPPQGVGVLKVGSRNRYAWVKDGLVNGATWATDRDYTFTNVPTMLRQATYIKTAMEDKNSNGDSFLSFEITRPVTVYVGYDPRVRQLPGWLSGWQDTRQKLPTSANGLTLKLYAKQFNAGSVTLGGNRAPGVGAMYTVVVRPQ